MVLSFRTQSWTNFSFSFSLVSVCVCKPNKVQDNTWSLLSKFEDESHAGMWQVPKKLSDHSGGCWNELEIESDG